jgi:hypothetical protein
MVGMLPEYIRSAMSVVAGRLSDTEAAWMIGGSCGLILHGVEVAALPRDMDMYTDSQGVAEIAGLLRDFTLDDPEHSQTEIYESLLSHYRIGGMTLELVGGFIVRSGGSRYMVQVKEGLLPYVRYVEIEGFRIPVMPLAHELVFNILRSRPDRYRKIAEQMRLHPDEHLPALYAIQRGSVLTDSLLNTIGSLLGYSVREEEV